MMYKGKRMPRRPVEWGGGNPLKWNPLHIIYSMYIPWIGRRRVTFPTNRLSSTDWYFKKIYFFWVYRPIRFFSSTTRRRDIQDICRYIHCFDFIPYMWFRYGKTISKHPLLIVYYVEENVYTNPRGFWCHTIKYIIRL